MLRSLAPLRIGARRALLGDHERASRTRCRRRTADAAACALTPRPRGADAHAQDGWPARHARPEQRRERHPHPDPVSLRSTLDDSTTHGRRPARRCSPRWSSRAPSQAAPKRDRRAGMGRAWRTSLALGIKPVGGADLRGYRQYVSVGLPGGITDVGTRQEPSIERIASLRPDMIIVPSNRAGRNLRTLRRIARVLVTNPYPGDTGKGAQFNAMVQRLPRGRATPSGKLARRVGPAPHDASRSRACADACARAKRGGSADDRDAGRHDRLAGGAPVHEQLGSCGGRPPARDAQRLERRRAALRLLDGRRRGAAPGAGRLAGVRVPEPRSARRSSASSARAPSSAWRWSRSAGCATSAAPPGCSAGRPRRGCFGAAADRRADVDGRFHHRQRRDIRHRQDGA